MKFRVCRTRKSNPLPDSVTPLDDRWGEIEIDTLEQLLDFCSAVNGDLILSKSMNPDNGIYIEIYGDYRE